MKLLIMGRPGAGKGTQAANIKEYYNMNVDYYVVNGFLIDNEKLTKVLSIIGNITKENVEESHLQVMDSFTNIDTGFLYKDVVSKVKKWK